ncbi:DUF1269 domain-containing protein [Mycolicibacterium moriokaense]|nr:DUF1269 domain-containing protein [Mycolicibacterium moriokaense]
MEFACAREEQNDQTQPNEESSSDACELIVISCYGDLAYARKDFDELSKQVRKKRVQVRESVLLAKNADGTPIVLDTSSGHHGRTGAIVGASMGFLLGMLTIPALPVSVAVGAMTGAAVAKFADHTLKVGLRHDIAESLAAATGVVITVVRGIDELWARRALGGASRHISVPFPESTIASLELAVADAMNDLGESSQPTR